MTLTIGLVLLLIGIFKVLPSNNFNKLNIKILQEFVMGLVNSYRIIAMTMIANWTPRKEGFMRISLLYLAMMLAQIAQPYTFNLIYPYFLTAFLCLTILPLNIWIFFYLDPLDAGIAINEHSDILNSIFNE